MMYYKDNLTFVLLYYLLNLLNYLRKKNDAMLNTFDRSSTTPLINSITHEHSCKIFYMKDMAQLARMLYHIPRRSSQHLQDHDVRNTYLSRITMTFITITHNINRMECSTVINLTSPFPFKGSLGVLYLFFHFVQFFIEISVSEQWRTGSDGAFCGI